MIFSSTPARLDRKTDHERSELLLEGDRIGQNHLADTHERLYITALPIYRALFGGIRNLSQWRSIPRTLTAMAIYFTLWHYRLLLYSALLLPMLWLLKMRDHPPAPELLRHSMLTKGHQQLVLKRHLAMSKGKVPSPTPSSGQEQRATAASQWADEVAAMHEKAKNVALWRSPPATLRVFACLAMMLVAVVLADGSTLSHCFALSFGVWFFILRPVWTQWPRLRVLPDLAGTLSGTPDDEECAMEAIRRRANAGKPVLENPIMLITLHDLEDDDMHNDKDGCEFFFLLFRWLVDTRRTDHTYFGRLSLPVQVVGGISDRPVAFARICLDGSVAEPNDCSAGPANVDAQDRHGG